MDLALPPGTCMWRGKLGGGQQRLPGEWDDTMLVGAARGTRGDTRQETVVRRDASPSLCCLVPGIHTNTHVFHGLRKPPQHFGNPLQRGHPSRRLTVLKLPSRWVSGGQELPPAPQPGLPFPPSQPLSPSRTQD